MSENTRFTTTFRFKIAARLAVVLLCVSSSLVFTDVSWGKKPTREEIQNLIEKLDTNDEIERDKTIGELRNIGKDAVPDVVKAALENESLLIRDGAKEVFQVFRVFQSQSSELELVADELMKALEDKDKQIRRRAIEFSREMSFELQVISKASEFVPKLIELLNDKESEVRSTAADTLGNIGQKSATDEAIQALTKLLNDKDSSVRYSAANAFTGIGEKAANNEVIKALTKLLNDKDSSVRYSATVALGSIGKKAATNEVVETLTKLLNDKEIPVRSSAAFTLMRMGETAANDEVIQALIKLLNDKESLVRINAAGALGSIGEKAATDEVIQALIKLLNDKESSVRSSAASALGSIGEKATTDKTIKILIKLLNDKRSEVRINVALSFPNIALSIQDKAQANQLSLSDFDKYIPKLEKALKIIESSNFYNSEQTAYFSNLEQIAKKLRRSLLVIKEKRKALFWNSLLKNPFIIIPSAYLIFFPSLWFLLLRLKPISLIQINEILKPYELCFPKELGGVPVKSRDLLLFSFFKFRPRVLDAWVKKNIPSARERFESKKTVQERSIHIPVAATLNNQNSLVVTGKDLKPTFNRNRACLLIYGEGGAGKTSLACQVGRWVMSDDSEKRPAQHLMLPVLIEEELRLKEHQEDEATLLEAIQGQLQDLIDSPKAIPEELLEQLLRQRRILVIVDHFSEMSEATRRAINPDSPNFCINALVVTSRLDEKLGRITKTTLHPHRINGDRLSSFMDDYLSHRGHRENFTDIEFFNACIQLSKMVGTRNITVLLAKLFAEQLISSTNSQDLPNNIPELMLEYLNQINRDVVEDKVDDRSIHKDAKILAWQCLEQNFRPIPIARENALINLGDDSEDRLNYLENRLHLIQTIGAGKDQIRFVLDPLAEYLAGLHLLELFGNQQQLWQQFLQKAADTEDAPESIQGFLLALRDCYLAKGKQANIPEPVAKQLENLPVLSMNNQQ